jgi:hypothetical protein
MGRKGVGLALVLGALLTAGAPQRAQANWLTHIAREAGEAGGKAASHAHPNLGPIGKALSHLESLSGAPKGALAAHATPEGHWQFVNREGQTFTAGTPDEFKRILPTLAPEAGDGGKLSLYLSEDSVFSNRAHLDSSGRRRHAGGAAALQFDDPPQIARCVR